MQEELGWDHCFCGIAAFWFLCIPGFSTQKTELWYTSVEVRRPLFLLPHRGKKGAPWKASQPGDDAQAVFLFSGRVWGARRKEWVGSIYTSLSFPLRQEHNGDSHSSREDTKAHLFSKWTLTQRSCPCWWALMCVFCIHRSWWLGSIYRATSFSSLRSLVGDSPGLKNKQPTKLITNSLIT